VRDSLKFDFNSSRIEEGESYAASHSRDTGEAFQATLSYSNFTMKPASTINENIQVFALAPHRLLSIIGVVTDVT
jgi:hypothetical protein